MPASTPVSYGIRAASVRYQPKVPVDTPAHGTTVEGSGDEVAAASTRRERHRFRARTQRAADHTQRGVPSNAPCVTVRLAASVTGVLLTLAETVAAARMVSCTVYVPP